MKIERLTGVAVIIVSPISSVYLVRENQAKPGIKERGTFSLPAETLEYRKQGEKNLQRESWRNAYKRALTQEVGQIEGESEVFQPPYKKLGMLLVREIDADVCVFSAVSNAEYAFHLEDTHEVSPYGWKKLDELLSGTVLLRPGMKEILEWFNQNHKDRMTSFFFHTDYGRHGK